MKKFFTKHLHKILCFFNIHKLATYPMSTGNRIMCKFCNEVKQWEN